MKMSHGLICFLLLLSQLSWAQLAPRISVEPLADVPEGEVCRMKPSFLEEFMSITSGESPLNSGKCCELSGDDLAKCLKDAQGRSCSALSFPKKDILRQSVSLYSEMIKKKCDCLMSDFAILHARAGRDCRAENDLTRTIKGSVKRKVKVFDLDADISREILSQEIKSKFCSVSFGISIQKRLPKELNGVNFQCFSANSDQERQDVIRSIFDVGDGPITGISYAPDASGAATVAGPQRRPSCNDVQIDNDISALFKSKSSSLNPSACGSDISTKISDRYCMSASEIEEFHAVPSATAYNVLASQFNTKNDPVTVLKDLQKKINEGSLSIQEKDLFSMRYFLLEIIKSFDVSKKTLSSSDLVKYSKLTSYLNDMSAKAAQYDAYDMKGKGDFYREMGKAEDKFLVDIYDDSLKKFNADEREKTCNPVRENLRDQVCHKIDKTGSFIDTYLTKMESEKSNTERYEKRAIAFCGSQQQIASAAEENMSPEDLYRNQRAEFYGELKDRYRENVMKKIGKVINSPDYGMFCKGFSNWLNSNKCDLPGGVPNRDRVCRSLYISDLMNKRESIADFDISKSEIGNLISSIPTLQDLRSGRQNPASMVSENLTNSFGDVAVRNAASSVHSSGNNKESNDGNAVISGIGSAMDSNSGSEFDRSTIPSKTASSFNLMDFFSAGAEDLNNARPSANPFVPVVPYAATGTDGKTKPLARDVDDEATGKVPSALDKKIAQLEADIQKKEKELEQDRLKKDKSGPVQEDGVSNSDLLKEIQSLKAELGKVKAQQQQAQVANAAPSGQENGSLSAVGQNGNLNRDQFAANGLGVGGSALGNGVGSSAAVSDKDKTPVTANGGSMFGPGSLGSGDNSVSRVAGAGAKNEGQAPRVTEELMTLALEQRNFPVGSTGDVILTKNKIVDNAADMSYDKFMNWVQKEFNGIPKGASQFILKDKDGQQIYVNLKRNGSSVIPEVKLIASDESAPAVDLPKGPAGTADAEPAPAPQRGIETITREQLLQDLFKASNGK